MWFIVNAGLLKFFPSLSEADNSLTAFPVLLNELIIIIMTLFKCQMYLARTALIGDTFQIELEFRNVGF